MEDKLFKIGLVICASNYERQQNAIKCVHKALKDIGNCVLYVFTNYGIFRDGVPYPVDKVAVYDLLDTVELDGCIIDGNIGSSTLAGGIAEKLNRRNIPFITVNLYVEGNPFLSVDSYASQRDLLQHLIDFHHCKKINIVVMERKDLVSRNMIIGYKDILAERGMEFDEKRIIRKDVTVENGREIYRICEERGILDADAIVFAHDVLAIAFCSEYMAHGYKVPEDMKLCTLNCSANSIVFRPSITGVGRDFDSIASTLCDLLFKRINHEEIPMENYYPGTVIYGQSCPAAFGVSNDENLIDKYQQIVFAKIGAGNQISQSMRFNGELEDVTSMDDFGDSMKQMMEGIGCDEYFCTLNSDAVDYIMNRDKNVSSYVTRTFEEDMIVLVGNSKRGGTVKNKAIPLKELTPIEEKSGDIYVINPIGYKKGCFGYLVVVNNYLPIEVYNFRICYESIGISIENLHRQMTLRNSIAELDELHMRDSMTGLYNRFAIKRFRNRYYDKGAYTVVMIDMDNLKFVNDQYGHLAGNNAINITADSIKSCVGDNDLVIRYGGDEFVVVSENTDLSYWNNIQLVINSFLINEVNLQKLPYTLGVSLGAAVSEMGNDKGFEACLQAADSIMYANKRKRKAE